MSVEEDTMKVGTRIDGTDYLFEVSHAHTFDGSFVDERFSTLTGALMRMKHLRDSHEGATMRVIGHDDLVTVTAIYGEPDGMERKS